ncbi:hypothetical protein [Subsaximicrobium wynnwilliamsii]|nr:hypothetical protein [Subsaximicrobium wynnwilliamsii]
MVLCIIASEGFELPRHFEIGNTRLDLHREETYTIKSQTLIYLKN